MSISRSVVDVKRRIWLNSGYGDAGASMTRRAFKKYASRSGSPHADINRHNATLRSRARSLYMGSPLATSAIKSLRTSVVGQGLHLHAKVKRKYLGLSHEEAVALNAEIEEEFELWAGDKRSVDVTRLNDFYELQQIAMIAWRCSGDVFCGLEMDDSSPMRPYSLRLRLIEADRVSTPGASHFSSLLSYGIEPRTKNRIYDGVEIDVQGGVVAYHVRNTYPREVSTEGVKWTRVLAVGEKTGEPNILHLMDAERPDQYRGVTCLAPAIESLLQLGRYLNSEESAALLESYLSLYITSNADSDGGPSLLAPVTMPEDGEEMEEEERDPADYELSQGGVAFLKPGEGITAVEPKRPGTQFDPFICSVATQIGAALEIPVDVLLKSYNSSYSASRAALQNFWEKVRMDRDWFASDFCAEIYAVWFAEAVARGRIKAPGFFTDPRARMAYLSHEWNGPAMPHLDPVKEATAMEKMVKNGWMTNTQATTQLNGGDFMANMEQLKAEGEIMAPLLALFASAVAMKEGKTLPSEDGDEPNEEKN